MAGFTGKLFFLIAFLCIASSVFAWDDNNFQKRRSFNVTQSVNLTNTTLLLNLNNSNFDYLSAQSNLYDFAVYCNGARQYIWNVTINTSSGGQTTFATRVPYTNGLQCYYYYNSTATITNPQFNGQGAFKYFNDANSTTGFAQYNTGNGTWVTTSNSTFNVTTGNSVPTEFVYQLNNLTNYTVIVRARINQQGSGGDFVGTSFNLKESGGNIVHYRLDSSSTNIRINLVTILGGEDGLGTTAFTDVVGEYYVYKAGYFISGSANITGQVLNKSGQISSSNNTLTSGAYGMSCYGATSASNCEVDYIAVFDRNATDDPIAFAFGSEENQSNLAFGNATLFSTTIDYETNFTNYNVTVDTGGLSVTNVSIIALEWNSVNYSGYNSSSVSGVNYSFGRIFNIPLIDANNTVISHRWFFNITYSNGTTYQYFSSSRSQNIYFVYGISSFTASPSSVLQGQNINATVILSNASVANSSSLPTFLNVFATFYGRNHTLPQVDFDSFSNGSITAPSISATLVINSTMNITYNSITKERSSGNVNIQVSGFQFATCNGTYPVALNFTFNNEENTNQLIANSSMNATFTVWDADRNTNSNFTFNTSGVSYFEVCIIPAYANVSVDSFQQYSAVNSSQAYYVREYFLWNASVDNATDTIRLFQANASLNKPTQFTLKDSGGSFLKDHFIHSQRYYPELNQYLTVSMMLTDDNGLGNTYLVPNDVWFRFVVINKQNRTVFSFTPQKIFCSPSSSSCAVALTVNTGAGGFLDYLGKVAFGCSVNLGTNNTVCTYTDTSGLFNNFTLTVNKIGLAQDTQACTVTSTSSSGTLACSFNASGSGEYTYVFFGGSNILFDTGSFTVSGITTLFGTEAIFLVLILFVVLVGTSVYSMEGGVLMAGMSLLFAVILGLFEANANMIFGVVIGALVIGWFLRRR